MNKQVSNILRNMLDQYKADFKCLVDQIEIHMAKADGDFTKLNDCMNTMVESQNMMRTLLGRLWIDQ